jgi:hypothetical protein
MFWRLINGGILAGLMYGTNVWLGPACQRFVSTPLSALTPETIGRAIMWTVIEMQLGWLMLLLLFEGGEKKAK